MHGCATLYTEDLAAAARVREVVPRLTLTEALVIAATMRRDNARQQTITQAALMAEADPPPIGRCEFCSGQAGVYCAVCGHTTETAVVG